MLTDYCAGLEMSTDLLCRIGDVDRFTVPDWSCQHIYGAGLEMSTDLLCQIGDVSRLLCRIGDVSRFNVPDWRYYWYRDEHPSVI